MGGKEAFDAVTILQAKSLSKSFGSLKVLDAVDLAISKGEVVTLIGPSGSGKSTLLRCLNLLEQPDQGELVWHGRSLPYRSLSEAELSQYRRHVGMVFQHFHLFPHLTALENVMEGPRQVLKMARQAAAERAQALLLRVGLADKGSAYPAQLSGGQKQRVAIARALALEPSVLLLDEATSALDIEMVAGVNELLRELATCMTMVAVTHDLAFAAQVSTRIGFMDAGRLLEIDSPEKMLAAPTNSRAREFLAAVSSLAPPTQKSCSGSAVKNN